MIDVVNIGYATLYHGDSTEIIQSLPTLDAVITDPPYGMEFLSKRRMVKHKRITNDDDSELFLWACGIDVSHSRYVFCRWDGIKIAPVPKSCVTWVKNNWSMGDLEHEHARQTEVALFWPGPKHRFPTKRPADVVYSPSTGNQTHPAEKPVYLMEQFVNWTEGVVLDPFMGSGATGVACANFRRRFIGIEIERKYFDIACERIDASYSQGRLFE